MNRTQDNRSTDAGLIDSKKSALLPLAIVSVLITGCGGSGDSGSSDSGSSSALVINEIVAKDASGGNDWIEFYVTDGSVNLGDYTIVDDDADHEPQSLPDVILSAGEYLVIEAIDDEGTASEGSYSVTFKLGSSDSLTLALNGATDSTLSWEDGEADEGHSYGLLPNGTGSATTLNPTKGYSNDESGDVVLVDTVVDSYPVLVINEIVAKDSGNDWIEVYVSGDESVYLGDYTVIDDDSSEAQTLPNITLSPGEYYTIYATDEVLDFTDSVDFKLGSSDSVSLFQGDDLIDYIEWDKGDALYGFSYGRYQDGDGAHQTLAPTMTLSNTQATRGPLVINEIVSSDAGGGNDWFELYNNGSDSIDLSNYSVIDESDDIDAVALPDETLAPGEFITIYATDEDPGSHYVSFKLGSSDSLSLILNEETVDYLEWDDSDAPQGYSYGAYPDGSWDSSTLSLTASASNNEVVVFDTTVVESIYVNLSTDDWDDIIANALDEENHTASITYKGVTLDNVAIRTKGNSSLSAVANSNGERFSFKIDMNEYESGQKLLNLKKLNLNNNYKDPTYMRETIGYNLMREMGIPAPKTAYANLYINDELHGLYTLVEQVDSEFLEQHFTNPDGDLYKPDTTDVTNGVGNDLKWIDALYDSYTAVELKTNEESTDNQALITFLDELNNGSDYESVMDVNAILRYLAVSTALGNLDSYQGSLAHNYYIYENSNSFSVIPWDLNESFGTFSMGCTADEIINLYIDEPTASALSERPLIEKLLQNSDYTNAYHGFIADLVTGGFAPSAMEDTINELADLIRTSVYVDPTAFYSSSDFETSLTDNVGDIPGLLTFVTDRVSSISDQLDGTVASSGDGSGSCSGDGGAPIGGAPGGPGGPPPF